MPPCNFPVIPGGRQTGARRLGRCARGENARQARSSKNHESVRIRDPATRQNPDAGVALISGGVLGLSKMGIDLVPAMNTAKTRVYLDYVANGATQAKAYVVAKYESYFHAHEEKHTRRRIRSSSPAPG